MADPEGGMAKVTIEAELSERLYRAYLCEARRTGKKVEALVERLVNELIEEFERSEDDHPVWVS
jgi:hypothetical protein